MNKIFNLKSYFVFLGRNKMYTAINVVGLAVSLALVVVIGLYAEHETTLDSWQKDADRTYVLGGKVETGGYFIGSHWRMQDKLKSRYPEIEQTCAVTTAKSCILESEANTKARANVAFADKNFFTMFDYRLEEGDRSQCLADKNSIVISRRLARVFFGDANPIGKNVLIAQGDTVRLKVTAIMDEMKNTVLTPLEALVNYELALDISPWLVDDHMSNANAATLFIKTKPGTNLPAKTKDMAEYFKTFFWFYQMKGLATEAKLFPLQDVHFEDIGMHDDGLEYGDSRLVKIMTASGLAILLFALMNYINLTVAQGGFRAREMAMRRLLGSQRRQVVGRLIMESLTLCAMSLVVALVLAAILLPAANRLLNIDMQFAELLKPVNIAALLAALVVFSVSAGIVPAIVISSAKPIDVVRGTLRRRTKMLFSKVFITLQNVITIVMLGASITMILQTNHLVNAPLGYNTDRLMQVPVMYADSASQQRFVQEMKQLPCVEMMSAGYGLPLNRGNNTTFELNGKKISFQYFQEDTTFMKLTGLELLRDNHTSNSKGNRVFVNRQALREEGLDMNAKEIRLHGEEKYPIDGVLKDFHIGTITSENTPVIIFIVHHPDQIWNFTLRYRGDAAEAFRQVNELHKKIFDVDIDTTDPVFVDQQIQQKFESNIRTMRLVTIFTVVAIVISLMGLVAMSTYFIEQRRREIAVRRVFGGSTRSILASLIRSFMVYSLVAFVIAIPIIYYMMSDWLADFSYRISLSPLIFIAAGVASALISLVAVFFQSRQAANENPAVTIKENG